VLWRSLSSF